MTNREGYMGDGEEGASGQRDNTSRFALRSLKIQGTCSKQRSSNRTRTHAEQLDGLSGTCVIQIECTCPWERGQGATSVEDDSQGVGHEFMHELESCTECFLY